MSNVTTRSTVYIQDPEKPNNPRAKVPAAQVISVLNSNNGNISVQVIGERGEILHSGTSNQVVNEIKQYGYDKTEPEKYGKILQTVERDQTSLKTEYQKIVADTQAQARAETQNDVQPTGDTPTPSVNAITNTTSFTVPNSRPPQPAETVRSTLDLNNGTVNTQVVGPDGQILYQGNTSEVVGQIRNSSDYAANRENNEKIVGALERQQNNLDRQYQKYSQSKTAKEAQDSTGEPNGTAPVDATSKANIEKANTTTTETPAPASPAQATPVSPTSQPAAQVQQPTVANTEDQANPKTVSPAAQQADNQDQRQRSPGIQLERINPLDRFASYTYNFVLAALDPKEEYNKMVSEPDYNYKPKHVLIASGAKKDSNNYPRAPGFNAEFYIDDVKFDTIVGLNARSKSGNVLKIDFTIREPYGVTLFDRLYELTFFFKNFRNYIEIPYLLIIEFVGYDDDGTPVKLLDQTKYIPIKLLYANLKVTGAGSEYQCQAVPYNQLSQMAGEHGSTPVNVQVTAKTVGEFFADITDTTLQVEYSKDQREAKAQIAAVEATAAFDVFADKPVTQEDIRKKQSQIESDFRKKYYNVKSYPQALDAFQELMKQDKKLKHKNIFRFIFAPQLADSVLYSPKKISSNRESFGNDKKVNTNTAAVDLSGQAIFNINGGTSIADVINMVMRNSDYIRSQVENKTALDGNKGAQEVADENKKPLNWWKITTVVKLLEYDEQKNTFAKEITYYIDPYIVYNTKSPTVPKSFPNNWLQEYKYIFTGDNRSILDLDLKFDALFFTLTTVNPTKWKLMNYGVAADEDIEVDFSKPALRSFMPSKFVGQSANMPEQVGNLSNETATGIAVSDLYDTILTNAAGDMISVDLTIIGDPRYIKQDDVFYNTGNSQGIKENLLSKNNSVIFDYEERYVKLIFNTPTDYDPETGLLDNGKQSYMTSRFSGLYRIIRIENTFSRGKFTQVLQLVRLYDQKQLDIPPNRETDNQIRSTTITPPAVTGPAQRTEPGAIKPSGTVDEIDIVEREIMIGNMFDADTVPDAKPEPIIAQPQQLTNRPVTYSVVEDIDQGNGTYALWDNNTGTYAQRGLTKQDAEISAKSFAESSRAQFDKVNGVTDQDRLIALRLTEGTNGRVVVKPEDLAKQRKLALQAEAAFQAGQTNIQNEIEQQRIDGINFFRDLNKGIREDQGSA